MYEQRKPRHRNDERWSRLIAVEARKPECTVWREHRVACNWTQAELAALIGVARETLVRWETGVRWPRAALLRRYVDALERLSSLEPREHNRLP